MGAIQSVISHALYRLRAFHSQTPLRGEHYNI